MYELAAVTGIDECTVRFQGTAWARTRLSSRPEGAGINITSILADYSQSYGGADQTRCFGGAARANADG